MKFEEAIKLLKEGKKIFLCTPACLVKARIYYIDKHNTIHELTFDDDTQKWYDDWQIHFTFNVDDLFSDEWEEYKWKVEE